MPIVRVEMSIGRSAEQKERFMREVTKLAADVLTCPPDAVDVIFTEISGDNWARGGRFYLSAEESDKKPLIAKSLGVPMENNDEQG
jgi:4-oxalocrotonate tautomerase